MLNKFFVTKMRNKLNMVIFNFNTFESNLKDIAIFDHRLNKSERKYIIAIMFIRSLKLILITALVTSVLLGASLYWMGRNTKKSPQIDLSRPSVIKEIRSLGNLETASYSIEKIVEAGTDSNRIQDFLFGDKLLLIANGKVVAGIDLSQVAEKDVIVENGSLAITLTAPVILSSNLDNSQTKVYDRTQGYLNKGNKDLETEARKSAEASITKAACEAGILVEARDNAIKRITQLFEFAGFTSVSVTIPHGSC